MWVEYMVSRKPSEREMHLIQTLAAAVCHLLVDPDWTERLLVEPLNDGGMGSLHLHMQGSDKPCRRFGRVGAELAFKDTDGVDVIASLYLDGDGAPFELDMWKVTYAPLIEIPEVLPPARCPTVT